jgi:SNF2 family DNA or RNA helicase
MTERTPLIDDFNSFKGPGVLVCNPIVAGAGLNITGANHVIHYNLEWNPAKEDQATFRVYRNGQLKETFVHRLFYVDTIDDVIDQRIQLKRNLSDLSLDALITKEDYLAGLQVSPGGAKND